MRRSVTTLLAAICLPYVAVTNAGLIESIDDPIHGADSVTRDHGSGLDWLDVTKSIGRPYSDVASQFGTGGDFQGWRYATSPEFETLVDNYTGNPTPYQPEIYEKRQNLGLEDIDGLVMLLGDTYGLYRELYGLAVDDLQHWTFGILADVATTSSRFSALVEDKVVCGTMFGVLFCYRETGNQSHYGVADNQSAIPYQGSFLVKAVDSFTIPGPGSIALLGLGLAALACVRKSSQYQIRPLSKSVLTAHLLNEPGGLPDVET